MNQEEAKKRIEKLKETINYHRYLYHVKDVEKISAGALDSLKHELFLLEQEFPQLITPDSPTQRVEGKVLDKFEKVEHLTRMLSLNDVFSFDELAAWEKRLGRIVPIIKGGYFAEIKMDGLAVSLIYRNGSLWRAATRGDGMVGEDVTVNIKTVESIPLVLRTDDLPNGARLKLSGEVEIRGEIYMTKEEFNRINKEQKQKGESTFANPRNLAAGSIRQLDPRVAASRKLSFMGYDLVTDLGQTTHQQSHELIMSLGLPSNPENRFCVDLNEVEKYYQMIAKKRDQLQYQIDGVVVSINDLKYFQKLGVVGKAPRYMIAYKFPAEQSTAELLDIEIQVGRTGAMTPVAILTPVNVAGSVVSRATLHNQDEIARKDIRIGDTVIVQKAGDVIPEVVESIKTMRDGTQKKYHFPGVCPVCGSQAVRPLGEAVSRCTNRKCFAQTRRQIMHFVSKGGFNIDGLGPKLIDRLLDEGLINDAADLFDLTKGDLQPLERFGEKSIDNLINAIDNSKKISFDKFIYALGIRHVGQQTAHDLAANFVNLDKLVNASIDELNAVEGIGEVVGVSVGNYFRDEKNLALINKLLRLGVKCRKIKESKGLSGLTFVITGTLPSYGREEAGELIRQMGGKVSQSVSRQTDFLLAGEKPGSKHKKAVDLGVKIISEAEFDKLLGK